MIERFDAVVASSVCEALVGLVDELCAASARRGRPRSPVHYSYRGDLDDSGQALARRALQACVERIATLPGPGAETMFTETVSLTVMGAGESIASHADNCQLDTEGRWAPSEYRQRCLSALLYLNHDFDGGELVFDQQGLEIKPHEGLLVVFPSDHAYTHRVNAVRSGRRYVLAIWLTVHRWHALLPERIPVRWPR